MTVTVLMDWVCQTCKAVTSGRKEKPRRYCTRPLVIRVLVDQPPYSLPPRRDQQDDPTPASAAPRMA